MLTTLGKGCFPDFTDIRELSGVSVCNKVPEVPLVLETNSGQVPDEHCTCLKCVLAAEQSPQRCLLRSPQEERGALMPPFRAAVTDKVT